LHHVELHQDSQGQGQEHEEGLGEKKQLELIGVVGHHAPQEGKEEHRQGLQGPHQPQVEGGVGEQQDQPAEGHRLHPGTGEADELAAVKQPEVAMAQGRKSGGGAGSHITGGQGGKGKFPRPAPYSGKTGKASGKSLSRMI
jgi:hypothetical protein